MMMWMMMMWTVEESVDTTYSFDSYFVMNVRM